MELVPALIGTILLFDAAILGAVWSLRSNGTEPFKKWLYQIDGHTLIFNNINNSKPKRLEVNL